MFELEQCWRKREEKRQKEALREAGTMLKLLDIDRNERTFVPKFQSESI
jgi:hypothetical protein